MASKRVRRRDTTAIPSPSYDVEGCVRVSCLSLSRCCLCAPVRHLSRSSAPAYYRPLAPARVVAVIFVVVSAVGTDDPLARSFSQCRVAHPPPPHLRGLRALGRPAGSNGGAAEGNPRGKEFASSSSSSSNNDDQLHPPIVTRAINTPAQRFFTRVPCSRGASIRTKKKTSDREQLPDDERD